MARTNLNLKQAAKFDCFRLRNGKTGVFIQHYTHDCIQIRVEEEGFYLFVNTGNGETCNRYYSEYDIVSKINN